MDGGADLRGVVRGVAVEVSAAAGAEVEALGVGARSATRWASSP